MILKGAMTGWMGKRKPGGRRGKFSYKKTLGTEWKNHTRWVYRISEGGNGNVMPSWSGVLRA